jgi:putative ABC transport system permease protein
MLTELRHAGRALLKTPGFTAVALISTAVGIGVNAAMFSVLDSLFMRPLPGVDTAGLVRLSPGNAASVGPGGFPWADYGEFRQQCGAMEVAASTAHGTQVRGPAGPESVVADAVSWNYFTVLRLKSAAGRFFTEADDRPGSERVVILSHAYWQQRWAGDSNVMGQPLRIGDQAYTVLGVAPPGFRGLYRFSNTGLWYPNAGSEQGFRDPKDRSYLGFTFVGRLRDGFTRQQARAEAQVVFSRLQPLYPPGQRPEPLRVLTMTESDWEGGGSLMLYVMPVVGLVLLVACANVAILLLARQVERRQEWATRLAMGATRLRLMRQQLTESLLLALGGLVLGLLLARGLTPLLPHLLFHSGNPGAFGLDCPTDFRVVGASLLLTLLAALAAGVAPCWRVSRTNLSPLLKGGVDLEPGRHPRFSLRNLIVIGQLAVSIVFVVTTAMLGQALLQALVAKPSSEPRELVLVEFKGLAATNRIDPRAYLAQLTERLQNRPDVRQTSLAMHVPGTDFGGLWVARVFVGNPAKKRAEGAHRVSLNIVETNCLETLGLRLQTGRAFDATDDPGSRRVAIINEALAQRGWAGRNPVGSLIRVRDPEDPGVEVIGVVRDSQEDPGRERASLNVYLPYRQQSPAEMILLVEARGRAKDLVPALGPMINDLDSAVAAQRLDTLTHALRMSLLRDATLLLPLAVLGLLAFAMAMAGLYGLISWSVARRTHEIGIRMALGAQPRDALRMVLKQGLWLATGGILIGLPAAAAVAQMTWSVVPIMRSAFLVAAPLAVLSVAGIVLLASYLPARRAARVDPMTALRCE